MSGDRQGGAHFGCQRGAAVGGIVHLDEIGVASGGAHQNRVVLDGVDHAGIDDHPHVPVLLLQLEQRRGDQSIRSEAVG